MIIGSGLLAKAFTRRYADSAAVWIYAAGVSNSSCSDETEYERERERLTKALADGAAADAFVYFSTCSIGDPTAANSFYVRHKIRMEALVATHRRHVIVRLPQIAGATPNPHTLLNYLFARVSRSEAFTAWRNASRNVIDIDDVETAVSRLLDDDRDRCFTVNVANPRNNSVGEIIASLEEATGKVAIVQWVDAGSSYAIDVAPVMPTYRALDLPFDDGYLARVVRKYYE